MPIMRCSLVTTSGHASFAALLVAVVLTAFASELWSQENAQPAPDIPWFEFAIRFDAFRPSAFKYAPSPGMVSALNACGQSNLCRNAVQSDAYQPFERSAALGFNVGYRPSKCVHKRLQIDTAFDLAGRTDRRRASGVLVDSQGKMVSAGSASANVWLLGVDARFVQPIGRRVLFSLGGGPTYLSDKLSANQSNVRECRICNDGRSGWGPAGIAEVTFLLHNSKKDKLWMGLSVHARIMRSKLDGFYGSIEQNIVMFGGSWSIQGYGK